MTVAVVGLGLIGGSLAIGLRRHGIAERLIGVERIIHHAEEAVQLCLVDEIQEFDDAMHEADLVLFAIPVDDTAALLPRALDLIRPTAIVADMGSTKKSISDAVRSHPRRARFVAAHPIAGTENSGPRAAFPTLFDGKLAIICDADRSDPDATDVVRGIFRSLGMRVAEMPSDVHDMHVAYVSHISHVTSFVLATTVLEIEKSTATIFDLAGSGFASTVRLAKSSPDMWTPIFAQNARYLCEALDAYIHNISAFKQMLERGEFAALRQNMEEANAIRRVLEGMNGAGNPAVPAERQGPQEARRGERKPH